MMIEEIIYEIRVRENITQQTLADVLGLKYYNRVSELENSIKKPNLHLHALLLLLHRKIITIREVNELINEIEILN